MEPRYDAEALWREASVATPDIYGDQQGDSEEDDDDDQAQEASEYMDEIALRRRAERMRNARRLNPIATPNIFADNYDPGEVEEYLLCCIFTHIMIYSMYK